MVGKRKVSIFSILVLIVGLSGLGLGAYSLYNYQQLSNQLNVSKPLVRVYLSSSYSIPSVGWATVNFDEVDYDTTGDFDITSDKFICSTSGYYLISGSLMFSPMNDGEIIYVATVIEGVLKAGSTAHASQTSSLSTDFTAIVYLNKGDYVEMWAYHTGTPSRTIFGNSAGSYIYFTIAATDILN